MTFLPGKFVKVNARGDNIEHSRPFKVGSLGHVLTAKFKSRVSEMSLSKAQFYGSLRKYYIHLYNGIVQLYDCLILARGTCRNEVFHGQTIHYHTEKF